MEKGIIKQLKESNRQLEQSLQELQANYQTLLHRTITSTDTSSSSNTAQDKNSQIDESKISSVSRESYTKQRGFHNKKQLLAKISAAINTAFSANTLCSLIVMQINPLTDPDTRTSIANDMLNHIRQHTDNSSRKSFTAAQLTNNSFAFLLNGSPTSHEVVEFATCLKKTIHSHLLPTSLTASQACCSIGIVPISTDILDANALIARAQINPDTGKEAKEPLAEFRVNNASHHTVSDMLRYLNIALAQKRFKLVFQPMVNLSDKTPSAYEVLIRILDSGNLVIPAKEIIPLACLNGMGEMLDKAVLQASLSKIQDHNLPSRVFIVTITNNSLCSPAFLPWLSQQLQRLQVNARQLILQISEIDVCNYPKQTMKFFKELDKIELKKAVCHFGRSTKRMGYLDVIKPDYIKLDKSIFPDIISKDKQENRAKTLIENLHRKNIMVVIPQIENINLLPVFWKTGVDFVQGYCIQEPRQNMDYECIQQVEVSPLATRYGASR